MGGEVFASCSKLTSVVIQEGVAFINSGLFSHCRALTSVTLPGTIEYMEGGAFANCSSLTTIIIPDSVKSIGFEYRASEIEGGEYVAGNGNQFVGCTKLNLAQQAALRRLGYTGGF